MNDERDTDEELPAEEKRVVLLYSGGLDSTVLLYLLREKGYEVTPLFVDYGQGNVMREGAAAGVISDLLGLSLIIQPIGLKWWHGLALENGSRTQPVQDPIIPGRNLLLLSVAASLARSMGVPSVAFASVLNHVLTSIDGAPAFVGRMRGLFYQQGLTLIEPYCNMEKVDVLRMGRLMGVPIGATWSCLIGGYDPCGSCNACTLRREAMDEANAGPGDPRGFGDAAALLKYLRMKIWH